MKNLIVSLSMLLLMCGIALGQEATLSVEAVSPVEPGEELTFQVKCDEINDEVSTFQWFLTYDPKVMTPVEIVNYHEDFPHFEWMNNLEYDSAVIILTWLSNEARNQVMKTSEVICEIQFEYKGGNTELKWIKADEVSISDNNRIYTAMWTEIGKEYYLKLKNAAN